MAFEKIFEGRSRSEMIGLFLALLELIRQDRVRIEQSEIFGSISVHLINPTPITEVMASSTDRGFKEYDTPEEKAEEAVEEAPFEEVDPAQQGREAVFEDEEEDLVDEDDEYSRRINAVEISEVDLGRSLNGDDSSGEPQAPDEATDGEPQP